MHDIGVVGAPMVRWGFDGGCRDGDRFLAGRVRVLILPLHRPLTRHTFPFMTAALLLVNVFVFLVLQSGDTMRRMEAAEQYVESGLGALELPAYRRHLDNIDADEALAEFDALPDDDARIHLLALSSGNDVGFEQALREGDVFASSDDRAAWQPLHAAHAERLDDIFTLRHLQRSSEFDAWRMIAATFLHGDLGHLIGNMLFLVLLGLLVEGALGPWRFLLLYLAGGFGASAASLAWRWGEVGGGLGASGAIAALMGAFCVLWGRRPVRFFYWFFVVFDYVRAPAIWLLPAWLGWEVWNLLVNSDAGIGFDAHAGGLVTGALLGVVLVRLGQVREDFLHEDTPGAIDTRFEQAQDLLGRMQLVEADLLLNALQTEQPARFDVALARYRIAAHGRDVALRTQRARTLLGLPAPDADAVRVQREAMAHAAPLPDELRNAVLRRWLALGAFDAVEQTLLASTDPANDAARWFDLALRRREAGDAPGATRALQTLVARCPDSAQAGKARFLLSESA